VQWQNRAHFFGFAAQTMRRILVDHARAQRAAKRGSGVPTVTLDEAVAFPSGPDVDLIALDDALNALARMDQRQSRIVELRFFAGLTLQETAEVLDIGEATVSRDWASARAWLYRELTRS
jgi:RNA polymerase sigma factor (TIGR02999 family)